MTSFTCSDVDEEEEVEEDEEDYTEDEETEDITTSSLHSIACEAIGNYTAMVGHNCVLSLISKVSLQYLRTI